MSLTLFHTPHSRSLRPLWLLEEMGLQYKLKTMAYDADYFASEEYRKINPMGKLPALHDDGQLIIESTVIMEYLLNRYGPSTLNRDKHHPEYAKFLQWLHMAESGMSGYLAVILGNRTVGKHYAVSKDYDTYCVHQIEKAFELLDHDLQAKEYLISDGFSAADISLGYTLYLASNLIRLALPENVEHYFLRLQQRSAWQKILAIKP